MTNANLSALVFNEQNVVVPLLNGGTLAVILGVASAQILPISPQTRRITFHNPGTNVAYVCQALDANGNALAAGVGSAGSWEILPGGLLTFTGDGAAGAWNGIGSAANTQLTVALSQTL